MSATGVSPGKSSSGQGLSRNGSVSSDHADDWLFRITSQRSDAVALPEEVMVTVVTATKTTNT